MGVPHTVPLSIRAGVFPGLCAFCSTPLGGTWLSGIASHQIAAAGKRARFIGPFCVSCGSVRRVAAGCCAGFCAALGGVLDGLLIVVVRHLQIMLVGDQRRVADPFADDMQREASRQFGLAAGTQIVKQFWPGFHASPRDDPQELGSQVRICVPVPRDQVFRSWIRRIKGRFQDGP